MINQKPINTFCGISKKTLYRFTGIVLLTPLIIYTLEQSYQLYINDITTFVHVVVPLIIGILSAVGLFFLFLSVVPDW